MVLLRPPSGHHPGKRQARHAHILQIGLHLTIGPNHEACGRGMFQLLSMVQALGMVQPLGMVQSLGMVQPFGMVQP